MFVLLFLLLALMRAIQSLCSKRASNSVKNTQTLFLYGAYYQFAAAAFSFITLCFSRFDNFSFSTMLCGFVTAIFLMIQFSASLRAIKNCKLIISSMFSNGGLILTCVLSWIWFGEAMSIFQGLGLMLFFISAYLISSSKQADSAASGQSSQKISLITRILLIIITISEGGVEISQKYFAVKIRGNAAWYSFFMFLSSAVIMSFGFIASRVKEKRQAPAHALSADSLQPPPSKPLLNKTLLVCGIALAFALFLINLSVTYLNNKLSSVIVFPVSSSISICITVLIGWVVYKEKLTTKNIIGVVLGLISIIVLAILTPETIARLF